MKIECASCYIEFEVEDGVIPGEVVTCPDCGADLEVIDEVGTVEELVAKIEDWGE